MNLLASTLEQSIESLSKQWTVTLCYFQVNLFETEDSKSTPTEFDDQMIKYCYTNEKTETNESVNIGNSHETTDNLNSVWSGNIENCFWI